VSSGGLSRSPARFSPRGADRAMSLHPDHTVDPNDIEAFGVDPAGMRTYADYLGIEPGESAGGEGRTATVPAAILGMGAWAVTAVALLLAGLVAGVWVPGDVARADRLVWDFGVLFLLGTVVLVAGPVFAYLRFRLAAPLATLAVYVAYWVGWAVLNGVDVVRILYVAALYEWLAIPVIAVAAVVEFLWRRLVLGRLSSVA